MRRLVVLLVVLAVGCVKSSEVKTANIKATYSALATGNGKTQLRANLAYTSGGFTNDALVLSGEDKVVVTVDGVTTPLVQLSDSLGATINTPASGSTIEFTLKRANNVLVTSTVVVPSAFTLRSDQENQTLSLAADAIVINASPRAEATEAKTWSAVGSCINPVNEASAEALGANILAGTIMTPTDSPDASCTMTVTLFRTLSGTPSSSLAGASVISATQSRGMDFSVTP